VLVSSVGVFTFVLSGSTERLFAWPIEPPLTAAFLGANYWVRFSGTVSWDGAGAWLYVAFLLGVLFLGLFGIRRTWLAPREEVPPATVPASP
jgi:hypothetical protein